uniref:Tox-REase-5 domain-containing protein n=1 Tax=Caenorhabditis tropicalis TaxID=1561998 RepID=A0A1I7V3E2_9PELO
MTTEFDDNPYANRFPTWNEVFDENGPMAWLYETDPPKQEEPKAPTVPPEEPPKSPEILEEPLPDFPTVPVAEPPAPIPPYPPMAPEYPPMVPTYPPWTPQQWAMPWHGPPQYPEYQLGQVPLSYPQPPYGLQRSWNMPWDPLPLRSACLSGCPGCEAPPIDEFQLAVTQYRKWKIAHRRVLRVEIDERIDFKIFLFDENGRKEVPQKVPKAASGLQLHRFFGIDERKWTRSDGYQRHWNQAYRRLNEWQNDLKSMGLITWDRIEGDLFF